MRRSSVRTLFVAACGALVLAVTAGSAMAGPGDLDATFGGGDGVFMNGFTTGINAIRVLADGKIVAVGATDGNASGQNFALMRFTADGSFDTTFGGGDGKVTTNFLKYGNAEALAVQGNGKIVVVGEAISDADGGDFAVARYNSNGTLDTTFSGDGELLTSFGRSDAAYGVAIRNTKIVVVGRGGTDPAFNFAVARYTSAGKLDATFSGDGKATTNFIGRDEARGISITPGGKIVVAGIAHIEASPAASRIALARYLTNGALDTTFSGDGKVTAFVPDYKESGAYGVALDPDGRVVVGGYAITNSDYDHLMFARFDAAGTADATFGGTGYVVVEAGTVLEGLWDVVLPGDGTVVGAGYSYRAAVVVRLDGAGVPDATFGGDGIVLLTPGGPDAYHEGRAVAVGPGSTLVVGGSVADPFDLLLARLES
jgi:uncharacterized delta-60 repeat protein